MPACIVRPFIQSDFEQCAQIYQANAPGRFPDGYFNDFCEWLRDNTSLILVAQTADEIRGFGGINLYRQDAQEIAWLSYGMVRPQYHRQGYGTTLLLSRLVTLPSPEKCWVLSLSTVGGSETFYRRFGFTFYASYPDEYGREFDHYYAYLDEKSRKRCRTTLLQASIKLDIENAIVPERKIAEFLSEA